MRVFSLRTVLCLTLAALTASTAFAGVRGKATKPLESAPVGRRIAQSDPGSSGVNGHPVPIPADVNATNERVIQERVVNPASTLRSDPGCEPAAVRPAAVYTPNSNATYAPMPMMMVMPMIAQPVVQIATPVPMLPGPSCSACGPGGQAGLSPAAAAAYDQAFGPGLYRSGAEMGQNHFPYYSYRRPWYFPGQPSFHRSTDYVW